MIKKRANLNLFWTKKEKIVVGLFIFVPLLVVLITFSFVATFSYITLNNTDMLLFIYFTLLPVFVLVIPNLIIFSVAIKRKSPKVIKTYYPLTVAFFSLSMAFVFFSILMCILVLTGFGRFPPQSFAISTIVNNIFFLASNILVLVYFAKIRDGYLKTFEKKKFKEENNYEKT